MGSVLVDLAISKQEFSISGLVEDKPEEMPLERHALAQLLKRFQVRFADDGNDHRVCHN